MAFQAYEANRGNGASGAHTTSNNADAGANPFFTAAENLEIEFTVFTVHRDTEGGTLATKRHTLDAKGVIQTQSGGDLVKGRFRRVKVCGLGRLLAFLDSLPPCEFVTWGVPDAPEGKVTTQNQLEQFYRQLATGQAIAPPEPIIARALAYIAYKTGPGVMPLDFDARKPRDHYPARDWRDLDDLMVEAHPEWKKFARLWRPSSSAFVRRKSDGRALYGAGSWRCYILVDDASRMKEIAEAFYQRLWKAGHGHIWVSDTGSLYDRSLFDMAMYQANREDFAAPPVIGEGLERFAPRGVVIPGVVAPLAGFAPEVPMRIWRRTDPKVLKAKQEIKPKAEPIREKHIEVRAEKIVKEAQQKGVMLDARRVKRTLLTAAEREVLMSEFVLYDEDKQPHTVGALLADKKAWDGKRFADPLDPGCYNDWRIAIAVLDTKHPYIFSHAHGEGYYRLARQEGEVLVEGGEAPRQVDETIEIMTGRDDAFSRAGGIVLVDGEGQLTDLCEDLLADYLGRCAYYYRMKPDKHGGGVPLRLDPPLPIVKQVLKKGGQGLRKLKGVVTAPTMRGDGSLLTAPGYDEATGLYLLPAIGDKGEAPEETLRQFDNAMREFAPHGDYAAFIENDHVVFPWNKRGLQHALDALWYPFKDFPFASDEDRGAHLAAILTAPVRGILPTAPAFAYDAPTAGSGKTKLGTCAATLAGAMPPAVTGPVDAEELRKYIVAELRKGSRAILIDNIDGTFKSNTIASLLTTETYSARILGASASVDFPANVMLLMTGNNVTLEGDLWRRVIRCRIEPQVDDPEKQAFALEPCGYTARNRMRLVAAALTILRRFALAGKPRQTKDTIGSFEQWDGLVRQCVLWLKAQNIQAFGQGFGDPAYAMQEMKENDSEHADHEAMVDGLHAVFGESEFTVAQIMLAVLLPGPDGSPQHCLLDAVSKIAAGKDGSISKEKLGLWLRRKREARVKGKRIVHRGKSRSNQALFAISRK